MKIVTIRFRAEPELKQKIQEAINEGLAKNMSQLIRQSIEKLLETSQSLKQEATSEKEG